MLGTRQHSDAPSTKQVFCNTGQLYTHGCDSGCSEKRCTAACRALQHCQENGSAVLRPGVLATECHLAAEEATTCQDARLSNCQEQCWEQCRDSRGEAMMIHSARERCTSRGGSKKVGRYVLCLQRGMRAAGVGLLVTLVNDRAKRAWQGSAIRLLEVCWYPVDTASGQKHDSRGYISR